MNSSAVASMPTFSSPVRFEDDTDNSSVSGLSDDDSEWTQISQSEDESDMHASTGAASDHDSDSLDGGPWEGLMPEMQHDTQPFTDEEACTSCRDVQSLDPPESSIHEDDHLINAVLDSSLTGTLETIRARSVSSSTRSLESSMSELQSRLRLSFPDPLTSSDQDIRGICEDMSQDCEDTSQGNMDDVASDGSDVISAHSYSSLAASVDTGSSPTPEVSAVAEGDAKPEAPMRDAKYSLSIVLYGSSTSARWLIAEKVMKLLFPLDLQSLSCERHAEERIYHFSTGQMPDSWHSVQIIDETLRYNAVQSVVQQPSVAVVLLPSTLPSSLPKHTLYLPIASQPALDLPSRVSGVSAFSWRIVNDTAQYSWDQLAIPKEKLLIDQPDRARAVIDEAELSQLGRSAIKERAYGLLSLPPQRLRHMSNAAIRRRSYTRRVALVAVVAAGLLGGMMRADVPLLARLVPRNTSDSRASLFCSAPINASVHLPTAEVVTSTALIASSLKDFAITVFHPMTSTDGAKRTDCDSRENGLGVTAHPRPKTAGCPCMERDSEYHSSPGSWSNRLNLSRDLAVRPASTVHVAEQPARAKHVIAVTTGASTHIANVAASAQEKGQALSTRVKGALSPIINVKAVIEVVGKDLQVIFEAINELLHALARQIDLLRNELVEVTGSMRGQMAYRHSRARRNAKKFREFSGSLWMKARYKARNDFGATLRRAREQAEGNMQCTKGVFENARKAVRNMRGGTKKEDRLLVRQMRRRQILEERGRQKQEQDQLIKK